MRQRQTVATSFGDAAYLEAGHGEPAVFVHGIFLGAEMWTYQLAELGDLRRCIAVDLLGHGTSPAAADEPLTLPVQARFVAEVIDALGLDRYHLVGNDSGGAIVQLLAAMNPERVLSLTLTNSEVHTNCPPESFAPFQEAARSGVLAPTLGVLAGDVSAARASLATSVVDPEALDETIVRSFFGPFTDEARAAAVQEYAAGISSQACVLIEPQLRALTAPALIVWGLADYFFDVSWSHWLAETLPGTRARIDVADGKLFFPLEQPAALNVPLREFWNALDEEALSTA